MHMSSQTKSIWWDLRIDDIRSSIRATVQKVNLYPLFKMSDQPSNQKNNSYLCLIIFFLVVTIKNSDILTLVLKIHSWLILSIDTPSRAKFLHRCLVQYHRYGGLSNLCSILPSLISLPNSVKCVVVILSAHFTLAIICFN